MNTSQQSMQSGKYTQSQFRSYLSRQQTQQQASQVITSSHISNTSNTPNMPNIPGTPNPVTPVPATTPTVVLFPVTQKTTQMVGQTPLSGIPSLPVSPIPVSSTLSSSSTQDNFLLDNESLPKRRRPFTKILAVVLVLALAATIYFIWQPAPTTLSPSSTNIQTTTDVSSAGTGSGGASGNTADNATGDIQVYVLGAVKTPGLYTLPQGARVFDLIKAAGGTLPDANLVALNMAAKLADGEEVYVTVIGETPPAYSGGVPGLNGGNGSGGSGTPGTTDTGTTGTGQLVNINTASVTDLMHNLHVSSKTAQAIVDYRTQNGDYTSVDQLLQVISKAIYDRIRTLCTV